MTGVAGLCLVALAVAAAPTNEEPRLISRPLALVSSNHDLAPFGSAPVVYLHGRTELSQPLEPGVYQTRPYAIILVVPETGLDDRCVIGGISGNSKMPNVKPDMRAVPKIFSQ